MRNNLNQTVPGWVLSVTILLIFVALVGYFEFELRRKGFSFSPWKHYRNFGYNAEGDDMEYYERDPVLFWRLRPLTTMRAHWAPDARIDANGFREESDLEEAQDSFRVLCLGDSGTFGWKMRDYETYPAFLESMLRDEWGANRVTVINAGVPGYTSHQGLHVLKKFGHVVRPQAVVFSFGYNDENNFVAVTDKDRKTPSRLLVAFHNKLFESRAYQWLYKEVALATVRKQAAKAQNGQAKERVPVADFKRNLQDVAALCEELNADLFLLPRSSRPERKIVMKEVAQSTSARYVDLEPFTKHPEVNTFYFGGHPRKEGYYEIAKIISREIHQHSAKWASLRKMGLKNR